MDKDWIVQHLTPKQQKVVEEFEKARPGYGAIALQNILNPNSGWAEIAESMEMEEIAVSEGFNSNSGFMHRYLH
jgi:hypothetical protein